MNKYWFPFIIVGAVLIGALYLTSVNYSNISEDAAIMAQHDNMRANRHDVAQIINQTSSGWNEVAPTQPPWDTPPIDDEEGDGEEEHPEEEPTPTPTPNPNTTPTPTPTPTPGPTVTPQPSPIITAPPTPPPTTTPTPTPPLTTTPTPPATTPTPTPEPTPTPTHTPTPTPTPVPTVEPKPTEVPENNEKVLYMDWQTQGGNMFTKTFNPSCKGQTFSVACSLTSLNMLDTTFTGGEVDEDFLARQGAAWGLYYDHTSAEQLKSIIQQYNAGTLGEGSHNCDRTSKILHYSLGPQIPFSSGDQFFNTIKESIDAGNPLLYYLNGTYTAKDQNGIALHDHNGPHFMAIKGYGTDDKGNYFIFNDPAKNNQEKYEGRKIHVDDISAGATMNLRVATAREPTHELAEFDAGGFTTDWMKPVNEENTPPPEPTPTPTPTPKPAEPIPTPEPTPLIQVPTPTPEPAPAEPTPAPEQPQPSGGGRRALIAQYALDKVGSLYSTDSASGHRLGPDSFDCSGLCYWCVQQAGYTMPAESWSTRDMGSLMVDHMGAKIVSASDVQPGDICVIAGTHANIYVGQPAVEKAKAMGMPSPEIHTYVAACGTGKGVRPSISQNGTYYRLPD